MYHFVGGKKPYFPFYFLKFNIDLSKWTKAFKKDYSKHSTLYKTFYNALIDVNIVCFLKMSCTKELPLC